MGFTVVISPLYSWTGMCPYLQLVFRGPPCNEALFPGVWHWGGAYVNSHDIGIPGIPYQKYTNLLVPLVFKSYLLRCFTVFDGWYVFRGPPVIPPHQVFGSLEGGMIDTERENMLIPSVLGENHPSSVISVGKNHPLDPLV